MYGQHLYALWHIPRHRMHDHYVYEPVDPISLYIMKPLGKFLFAIFCIIGAPLMFFILILIPVWIYAFIAQAK